MSENVCAHSDTETIVEFPEFGGCCWCRDCGALQHYLFHDGKREDWRIPAGWARLLKELKRPEVAFSPEFLRNRWLVGVQGESVRVGLPANCAVLTPALAMVFAAYLVIMAETVLDVGRMTGSVHSAFLDFADVLEGVRNA